jgi:hypothetical protein
MTLAKDVLQKLNEAVVTSGLLELVKQFDNTLAMLTKSLSTVKSVLQQYGVEPSVEQVTNIGFLKGVLKINIGIIIPAVDDMLKNELTIDFRSIRGVSVSFDSNQGLISIEGVGIWK